MCDWTTYDDDSGARSIDESAPSTSIQLRLRDGSRLVAKFNLTHTVADIRAFIAQASPGCASGSYTLQLAGFPPKQLTDPAQLISDGGFTGPLTHGPHTVQKPRSLDTVVSRPLATGLFQASLHPPMRTGYSMIE